MGKEKGKKRHTGLFRGLTAVSASLLTISIFGTQTALNYTGSLNSFFGTTSSQVVEPEGSSEDTVYYKSEFGDFNAENLQKLIQAAPSVGKASLTAGDGTSSVGSVKYAAEYGDERDTCLYPSTVVVASAWSQDRLVRRGQLLAEEAMYSHVPYFWAGGGDLHRTPFGGRNGEYYSEDSTMACLDAAIQLEESCKRGAQAGLKHLAGNDQELYREGLVMFFNEQAFREGSLRVFEYDLQQPDVHCLMQSFNRIGLVLSSSSYALCTEVLSDEWGFEGQQETDGVAGGAYKEHFTSEISVGTDTYCIDPVKTGQGCFTYDSLTGAKQIQIRENRCKEGVR